MQESKAIQKQLSPYNNKNLFSRYYLKNRLKRSTLWKVDEDELQDAFDELKRIYEREKGNLPSRTSDEEGLRDEFISPILTDVLGFEKEKEKTGRTSARAPDYALYNTREKKNQAVQSGDYYTHAISLVEAKPWKANLERKNASGGQATENNPTRQIVYYLIENDPQWGILTNGKKWRLVHREASDRLDTYYEIDIETIIAEDDLETFKYFYLFFRRESFEGMEGDKLLDDLREESIQYATEIGEDLEENIYQALEWIAKGYLENQSNDGIDNEPIDKIHDKSLILLYRLLFALYADSRGILGDPSGAYDDYNFSEMVDDVCEQIDEGDGYGKTGLLGTQMWEIFSLIDKGSEAKGIPEDELHIPAYNGGLFSEDKFFKEYNLHDKYLAKVIDLVARTNHGDEDGRARVDYFDLSVRHLGGVYEGLLEYQLEKADEDMVEVKESGDQVVKTVEQAEEDGDKFSNEDVIEEGQPYLVTDDGERKATGSYYTPDYIVKYIVENTVGPKVEEEIEGLETDKQKAEAILDMQILDPAMGSAHFLVEVIDYLATELVDYKEIEIDQAKREVARQCVYGVDINPLATELGKLSIWLKTISEDKPLSFLDHHIKTGNSLIGADIHDINRHPEEDEDSERQVTIDEEFGDENAGVVRANVQEMLKKFKEIQNKEEDSPEDIKEQEQLYQDFLDFPFRKRFDVLADVYTSHYFDNNYKVDDYNRLLQAFKLQEQKQEGDEEWNQVIQEDWVQKATDSLDKNHKEDNTSNEKGFFHWKLEFPEVFFDIEEGVEQEDAGFDAVVGNPPWISAWSLTENDKEGFRRMFETSSGWDNILKGHWDIYVGFLLISDKLVSESGRHSFIIPNPFAREKYATEIRKYFIKRTGIESITHFGEENVFDGVSRQTMIPLFTKKPVNQTSVFKFEEDEFVKKRDLDAKNFLNLPKAQYRYELSEKDFQILSSMRDKPKLGNFLYVNYGAQVSSQEKGEFGKDDMIYDEKSDGYKKFFEGRDLDRYLIKWEGDKFLDYQPEVMYGERSPKLFESEKIVVRHISGEGSTLKVTYDENGFYCDHGLILATPYRNVEDSDLSADFGFEKRDENLDLKSATACIASRLISYYYKNQFSTGSLQGSYSHVYPKPVRSFSLPEDITGLNDSGLGDLVDKIQQKKSKRYEMNLSISDYLGNYSDGKTLGEMYMPVEGLSDSILTDTKEERDNIKIGSVEFEENVSSLILNVSVKYKPEDDEGFDDEELDRWGYVETDLMPAMNFTVGDKMKGLIKEFVPVAVDEAGGFANFREKATKTNSVVDRLEDLTLPKLDDVEQGLEKFIENKEEAEKLEEEIQETDEQIDAIVFDLYDLNEEEVETVLDSLDTSEGEKASIMEKFEEVRS